jgi:hypothetical protein
MTQNEWAEYVKFGSRYQRPMPPPNCYYFNTKVFKQSLTTKHRNKSIMRTLKKLFGLAIIISVMASCNRYTGTSNGKGCGVWYPKKYSGKAPKMRGNAHMVSF